MENNETMNNEIEEVFENPEVEMTEENNENAKATGMLVIAAIGAAAVVAIGGVVIVTKKLIIPGVKKLTEKIKAKKEAKENTDSETIEAEYEVNNA